MNENKKPWIIIAQRRPEDLLAIEKALGRAAPDFTHEISFASTAEEVLRGVHQSAVRPIVISGQFSEVEHAGDALAHQCKKINSGTIFIQYSAFENHGPSADLAITKCVEGKHILIACMVAELTETTSLDDIKKILGIK